MITYITSPFKWFFKLESASGLVLLFAAIIALIVSNSGISDLYFSTLNQYMFIGINEYGLKPTDSILITDYIVGEGTSSCIYKGKYNELEVGVKTIKKDNITKYQGVKPSIGVPI